jgi:hypothetical protein
MRSKPVSPLSPLSFGEWVAGAELVGAMGAGGYQLRRLARGSRYELIVCGLTLPRLALWCGARAGEGAGYVPGAGFVGALVRDALGAVVVVSVPVARWGDLVRLLEDSAGGELDLIADEVAGWADDGCVGEAVEGVGGVEGVEGGEGGGR